MVELVGRRGHVRKLPEPPVIVLSEPRAVRLVGTGHVRADARPVVRDRTRPGDPVLPLDPTRLQLIGALTPALIERLRAEDTAAKRKVRELLAQYGERLAGLVEAGKAAGEVTAEIGTGAAVAHFIGTVQGLVMQSLLAGDPDRMRSGAANAFAIYRRGIAGAR